MVNPLVRSIGFLWLGVSSVTPSKPRWSSDTSSCLKYDYDYTGEEEIVVGGMPVDMMFSQGDAPWASQDFSDLTIYEVLQNLPDFSRIIKAIDFDNSTSSWLQDASADITFFAPYNHAIPRKPKHDNLDPSGDSIASIVDAFISMPHSLTADSIDKDHLKKIVHDILSYHILPEKLDSRQLGENNTFATALNASDGSFGGLPRRIHVYGPIFKKFGVVNFHAKILGSDIRAKNGVIHVINRPLFPPLSILDQSFLLPEIFSIWTSSLQKVNLSDELEYRVLPPHFGIANKTFASSVTAFIPSNSAWHRLPESLKLYLFSPFGERALKKLLQLHIVPNSILHTEWSFNASSLMENGNMHLSIHMEPTLIPNLDFLMWNEAMLSFVGGCSHHELPTHLHVQLGPQSRNPSMLVSEAWEEEQLPLFLLNNDDDNEHTDIQECCFSSIPQMPRLYLPEPPKFSDALKPPPPPQLPNPPEPPKHPDFFRPPSPPRLPNLPQPPRPPKIPDAPNLPRPPKPQPSDLPKLPQCPPHRKPEFLINSTVVAPTLLSNHSLLVRVFKPASHFRPAGLGVKMIVNGVPVALTDGVARNEAFHLLPRVINPRWRPSRPHDRRLDGLDLNLLDAGWEDWREWLPQWALED